MDQTVIWTSDDPEVAAVDPDTGVVSAGIKKGKVTITATSPDGLSDTYNVTVYPAPYVARQPGDEGDDEIWEYNLLDVLNVDTPEQVLKELHQRLTLGQMGGLKLGMYLDLESLDDGEQTLSWNDDEENLRIVIADFNQYKGNMYNDDTNHIKFVFKNIPVEKTMRSGNKKRNAGGYPYDGTGIYAESDYGTPVLRPYLEGQFLPGLKTAMGIAAAMIRISIRLSGI
jgi:hypothetical protein